MNNGKTNFSKLIVLFLTLFFSINYLNGYAETAKQLQKIIPKKTNEPSKNSLKPGDTVSGTFVSGFEPEPFVGLKYTFRSNSIGGEYRLPVSEETTEVVSMGNGYATLLLSGTFHDYREKVVKVSDIRSSGVKYVQFRYDGLTAVNVPYSKFKNATKVSVSNKSNDLSLWLVKGIGVVKLVENDKMTKGRIITELIDFRGRKDIFPDKIPNKVY